MTRAASTIVVRPMSDEDVAAVEDVSRASFLDDHAATGWHANSLRGELVRPIARAYVALEGGDVVGFYIGWLVHGELQVLTVAVLPKARRLGVASAILSRVLFDATSEGATSAFLELRASNDAARALYTRFGFAVTGERTNYYNDGETATLMTSVLAAPA